MTIQCFALQAIPDNADLARMALSSLVPDGGGTIEPLDFTVTQTPTASMTVNVANGRCWIDGNNIAHNSGRAYGNQGQYFVISDSTYPVTLTTADPSNPRIDVVYVAVQDAYYAGIGNQPVINVAAGIPVSGASYPANAPAIPSNAIALAWINVPANDTAITNSQINNLSIPIIGPLMWQYGGPQKTVFNNSNLTNAAGTGSRLIADLGMPPKPYDRIMNVSAMIGITCPSISSGVESIYIAASLLQSAVNTAQGTYGIGWTPPGAYIQSGFVTSGDILVPANANPLARAWVEVITGTLTTTVSASTLTQIWCTEYPTAQ